MKFLKKIFVVVGFLLTIAGASYAQNQFLEFEPVCQDSAGVKIPLLKRIYTVNGRGERATYHDIHTLALVVPTIGAVAGGVSSIGTCDSGSGGTVDVKDFETIRVCWDSAGTLVTLFSTLEKDFATGNITQEFRNFLGQKIVPTIGAVPGGVSSVSEGGCFENQTLLELDSLAEPQSCNCLYTIDQENISYELIENSQYVRYRYNKVVTRDCGAGAETILDQPTVVQIGGTADRAVVDYNTQVGQEFSSGGYVDSIRVFLENPSASLIIYLEPSKVATEYPDWVSAGGNTADLLFNPASPSTMQNAMESVISFALNRYASLNFLPMPTRSQFCEVTAGGSVKIRFHITHNPSGHYAAIDHQAGNRLFHFNRDGSTPVQLTGTGASLVRITAVEQASYTMSCGTDIFSTYFDFPLSTATTWKNLVLSTPNPSGTSGNGSCQGPCPDDGPECITPCGTISVEVVGSCEVRNVFDWVDPTSNIYTVDANTVHSLTVAVTSGTVTVENLSTSKTRTLPAGVTFSVSANSCELLQSGFKINDSGGNALVSIFY